MLYKKNGEKALSKDLFQKPTSEYRGTPFWAWNCKLNEETLLRQIDVFEEMGLGGFHMHVRTGLDTPYLSDEYMEYIRLCVNRAKEKGMLAWLYDEDRWPSGAAGGMVTKNTRYAAKNILFTPIPYGSEAESSDRGDTELDGGRTGDGELLAVYDIVLSDRGELLSAKKIEAEEEARGTKWYAYGEMLTPSGWFNDQRYLDTLSQEAVNEFVRVTHERYAEKVGDEFDKTVPAIFTDEPQFTKMGSLPFADARSDIFMPWTDGMDRKFEEACGVDFWEGFPEVFWELPEGRISRYRYLYHDFVSELFTSVYCDTLGKWCKDHKLMLGGHVMNEPTLESQTSMVGEAMRCYRGFDDMPGIDMLCDFHEYSTAKQAQSAKHQHGSEAMLSELYGVTGWDYDFRGHKLQGDWQAALGVTVRVQHLTWMSMKGESKRDYPACIGEQSAWYRKYSLVEDHFARVNTAMTRGKPAARVGVIHPIESYWLHWGPYEQTAAIRQQLEDNFDSVIRTLLFGLIDFDLIAESTLPDLCKEGGAPLQVGAMAYDAIVVPACETLRGTTLARLEAFRKAGGKLIFMGDCPSLVDAVASDAVRPLFEESKTIAFSSSALLDALEEEREIDIRDQTGARTDRLLYQLRKDEDCRWLFIANGKNPESKDVDPAPLMKIEIKGDWQLEEYDTLTGEIRPLKATYRAGHTSLRRRWFNNDSLLLRLVPGKNEGTEPVKEMPGEWKFVAPIADVTLDEPNVMLLDMAEYAADDGPWQPEEELLRLDNVCRRTVGIPLRCKHVVQPYLLEKETPTHCIHLRFTVHSEIETTGAHLALEDARECRIALNGEEVNSTPDGWYVDRAIETVALPALHKGDNTLLVTVPLAKRTNLEWMYLLGDFGVRADGRVKTLVPPVRKLAFGSYTHQGLPFYTGNVTYEFDVEADSDTLALKASCYRGALLDVFCDGAFVGNIIYSPYTVKIEGLQPGKHRIGLKLYGTRGNGFGPVHHDQTAYFYQDPNSWRSTGQLWSYEYQLIDNGILKTPEVK